MNDVEILYLCLMVFSFVVLVLYSSLYFHITNMKSEISDEIFCVKSDIKALNSQLKISQYSWEHLENSCRQNTIQLNKLQVHLASTNGPKVKDYNAPLCEYVIHGDFTGVMNKE